MRTKGRVCGTIDIEKALTEGVTLGCPGLEPGTDRSKAE